MPEVDSPAAHSGDNPRSRPLSANRRHFFVDDLAQLISGMHRTHKVGRFTHLLPSILARGRRRDFSLTAGLAMLIHRSLFAMLREHVDNARDVFDDLLLACCSWRACCRI